MTLNFADPRIALAQYPSWATSFPQKGESKVYVGQTVPLGYLYLASSFWIPEGTSRWYTDGQLVKVTRRSKWYAYFDAPIARTFHAEGILFQVPVEVGKVYTGSGVLGLTFAAEGVVRDWVVPDGWNAPKGLDLQACARMQIENVDIGRPLNPGSYGVGLQQSTEMDVLNLRTRGVRHPVIPWGVARSQFFNVIHQEPAHDFDFCHGFCEDLSFYGCDSGDRNGAVGNRWNAPCTGIRIHEQKNCRDLLIYGGCEAFVQGGDWKEVRLHPNEAGRSIKAEMTG